MELVVTATLLATFAACLGLALRARHLGVPPMSAGPIRARGEIAATRVPPAR